ncbi:hypothetical protein EVG20_g10924 [Dentipellis fragilis]|uniref:Uncharacterized protein n=1 Tax=Dentipellis fragilis TaxID=205917 RepID=A0A4Y9XSU5_9AGAM|nr:hypothetical protein EVG20_g10924 [Dentipellis fragilis]
MRAVHPGTCIGARTLSCALRATTPSPSRPLRLLLSLSPVPSHLRHSSLCVSAWVLCDHDLRPAPLRHPSCPVPMPSRTMPSVPMPLRRCAVAPLLQCPCPQPCCPCLRAIRALCTHALLRALSARALSAHAPCALRSPLAPSPSVISLLPMSVIHPQDRRALSPTQSASVRSRDLPMLARAPDRPALSALPQHPHASLASTQLVAVLPLPLSRVLAPRACICLHTLLLIRASARALAAPTISIAPLLPHV